jgi:hypothetical protein
MIALGKQLGGLESLRTMSAWEPACGELHMAKVLAEFCDQVRASDVFRYSAEHELIDFTLTGSTEPEVDLIVTNPPFAAAEAFIATALGRARRAVAMLVRSAFLEGGGRHERLFAVTPPTHVLQFVERVVMLEGRLVRANEPDPFTQDGRSVRSATAYCWLVWMMDGPGKVLGWPAIAETKLMWIPRCRERLERPGDYPDYARAVEIAPAPLLEVA